MAAAGGQDERYTEHLQKCSRCRQEVAWITKFPVAGRIPLAEPPVAWVEKAIELANPSGAFEKLKRLVAALVFDSWAAPLPVTVRGAINTSQRRLRFEGAAAQLDLRAEKTAGGWSFVGQVITPQMSTVRVQVGRQDIRADASGLFQWSATKPPRKIAVFINDHVLETPELTWRQRRKPS